MLRMQSQPREPHITHLTSHFMTFDKCLSYADVCKTSSTFSQLTTDNIVSNKLLPLLHPELKLKLLQTWRYSRGNLELEFLWNWKWRWIYSGTPEFPRNSDSESIWRRSYSDAGVGISSKRKIPRFVNQTIITPVLKAALLVAFSSLSHYFKLEGFLRLVWQITNVR